MFYDDLHQTIGILNDANIEEILTTLGVGATIGLVTAALAVLTGPIGWTVAVLGVVTGIILVFIVETIDLEELKGYLEVNQEDLVCALYNSTDADGARDAFEQILTDAGAAANQIVLVHAILVYDALNALYFKLEGAKGDELEARLDGYEGSVECGGCGIVLSGAFTWVDKWDFVFHNISGSSELDSWGLWWGKNTIENILGEFAIEREITLVGANTITFSFNIDGFNGYENPGDIMTYIDAYNGSWNNLVTHQAETLIDEAISYTGLVNCTQIRFRVRITTGEYRVLFGQFDIN